MISGERAKEIEKRLADLLDVEIADLRDYLRGNLKESAARRTGFRFIRGRMEGSSSGTPRAPTFPRSAPRFSVSSSSGVQPECG